MALGTLHAAFAGLGIESVISGNHGIQARGTTFNQRPIFNNNPSRGTNVVALPRQQQARLGQLTQSASAFLETDYRSAAPSRGSRGSYAIPVPDIASPAFTPEQQLGKLPQALYRLLDPQASVDLPASYLIGPRTLDNRELDKLLAALGRNKVTWRRALVLHEWLLSMGHIPDDRLCTTLIRVCSQHGQAMTALNLYDWMRCSHREGGPGLIPTVYTYTAAMRAALTGNMVDRAVKVWDEAIADGCQPDCRMATTLIEVCTRKGDTKRALATYQLMRDAAPSSSMAPSVHAYTAAMRAAAEGGAWETALAIWSDMEGCGCKPTGHAYAAVISACAAGGAWQRAVQLFDQMLEYQIKPDVVSCTALITALGADGQWKRGSQVIDWMLSSGVKPNVRTYTALITAMGNAQQWDLALDLIKRMKAPQAWGSVEPNAYTYSALLKTMGEQGHWQLAEQLFQQLEAEAHQAVAKAASEAPQAAPAMSPLNAYAVDWASSSQQASTGWEQLHAQSMHSRSAAQPIQISTVVDTRRLSSSSFGDVPTHMAEQVLDSPTHAGACNLPAEIPGQVNFSPPQSFSFFGSAAAPANSQPNQSPAWTYDNAATSGLQISQRSTAGSAASSPSSTSASSTVQTPALPPSPAPSRGSGAPAKWGLDMRGTEHKSKMPQSTSRGNKGPVNEVVCGAMMLAYERAGKWEQAINLLDKARNLGIVPNTIMYNTAMSSLGKSGRWEAAEKLFMETSEPDAVTHETLIAAYGMAGQAAKAEMAFKVMLEAQHTPRDYAYCGLIAAHSMQGNWKAALRVRTRMRRAGATATVHVYNALIAACERAQQFEAGLELTRDMRREQVEPNNVTMQLMQGLGSKGIAAVEKQQVAAAALSAAVAAAGTLVMRTGIW